MGRIRPESQALQLSSLSRTASRPSPFSDTGFSTAPWPSLELPKTTCSMFLSPTKDNSPKKAHSHNLELQLLTISNPSQVSVSPKNDDRHSTQLQLSISSSDIVDKIESTVTCTDKDASKKPAHQETHEKPGFLASSLKEQAREQLRLAMAEKAYAEEARQLAKRQIELAEQEFAKAKRIRQQAQAELEKAQALKDQAIKQINSTILQITCHACKQQFQAKTPPEENSLVVSYISSAITEGEVEKATNT